MLPCPRAEFEQMQKEAPLQMPLVGIERKEDGVKRRAITMGELEADSLGPELSSFLDNDFQHELGVSSESDASESDTEIEDMHYKYGTQIVNGETKAYRQLKYEDQLIGAIEFATHIVHASILYRFDARSQHGCRVGLAGSILAGCKWGCDRNHIVLLISVNYEGDVKSWKQNSTQQSCN